MIPRLFVPVLYATVIVIGFLIKIALAVWQGISHMCRGRAESCEYFIQWTSEWLETEEQEASIGRNMRLCKRRG